jgi:hypothetical protein
MRPIVALLCLVAAPLAAQGPVPELPGAGRPVDVEAHRARRAQLAERLGNGVVLVPAAERRDPEKDVLQDGDFRQDDYFFYLTGIETPGAWLMLVARQGSVGGGRRAADGDRASPGLASRQPEAGGAGG